MSGDYDVCLEELNCDLSVIESSLKTMESIGYDEPADELLIYFQGLKSSISRMRLMIARCMNDE